MVTPRKPGSMYGWPWRAKLEAIVLKGEPGECWRADPALCSIDGDGYAHFQAADTTEHLVHRAAVIADGREIPPGYEVDHVAGVCRHRDCGNPAHLEVVTKPENQRRAAAVKVRQMVCRRGHDKSDAYVYGNRWQCRTCTAERYQARKRVAV